MGTLLLLLASHHGTHVIRDNSLATVRLVSLITVRNYVYPNYNPFFGMKGLIVVKPN